LTEFDRKQVLFGELYAHLHEIKVVRNSPKEKKIIYARAVLSRIVNNMGWYEEYREYELMRYCKENNSIFKIRKTTL